MQVILAQTKATALLMFEVVRLVMIFISPTKFLVYRALFQVVVGFSIQILQTDLNQTLQAYSTEPVNQLGPPHCYKTVDI